MQTEEYTRIKLMAIALIQEGMGRLDETTEHDFSRFEKEGREWREYVIHKLNGFDLPPEFILGAIAKKWEEDPQKNVENFTRRILSDWKLL